MGVASLIFEPRPPNFENQYNFWRCLNGIKTIFWYLYWFQIYQKSGWVSSPFLKLVLVLAPPFHIGILFYPSLNLKGFWTVFWQNADVFHGRLFWVLYCCAPSKAFTESLQGYSLLLCRMMKLGWEVLNTLIWNLWKFWMIPNQSLMTRRITFNLLLLNWFKNSFRINVQ